MRNDKPMPNDSAANLVASQLLTAKEVSQQTRLSLETLAQWRSQRRGITFLKISRNCVRYRQCDLDAWLSERIVRTSQDQSGMGG
jgi:predicted DNA-binding transcriptional regulator AlpA